MYPLSSGHHDNQHRLHWVGTTSPFWWQGIDPSSGRKGLHPAMVARITSKDIAQAGSIAKLVANLLETAKTAPMELREKVGENYAHACRLVVTHGLLCDGPSTSRDGPSTSPAPDLLPYVVNTRLLRRPGRS